MTMTSNNVQIPPEAGKILPAGKRVRRTRKRKSDKTEAAMQKLIFSSSNRDALATQYDILASMQKTGNGNWVIGQIVDDGNERYSFSVHTAQSDQGLTADAMANRMVANVDVTQSLGESVPSAEEMIDAVLAGKTVNDVLGEASDATKMLELREDVYDAIAKSSNFKVKSSPDMFGDTLDLEVDHKGNKATLKIRVVV